MKLRMLGIIALAASMAACGHTQVPPAGHSLTITVTNAPCTAGTPAGTCGYVFSFAPVSGGTCPATTGSSYSPANQSSPVAQPPSGNATYVNTTGGETVCAIAQTVAGGAVSQPSAAIGPYTIPANPTAPALGTGTVAKVEPLPQIQPTEPTEPSGLGGLGRTVDQAQTKQMARLELKAVVR
jgi:hypothetical protein